MARRPTLPPPYPGAPAPGGVGGEETTGTNPSGVGQDPSWAAPPPSAWPQPGFEMERIPRHKLNLIKRRGRLGWILFAVVTVVGGVSLKLAYDHIARVSGEVSGSRNAATQAQRVRDDALARTEKQKAEIAALEQRAASLEGKARTVDQQAAAHAAAVEANAKVIEELKAALEGTPVPVAADGDRIVVLIAEDDLFSGDSAEVNLEGFRVLARLGKPLKAIKDRQVVVTAHGPAKGAKRAKNGFGGWELSGARASRVARYLVEDARLDGTRVMAQARTRSSKRGKIELSVQPVAAKSAR